MGTLDYTLQACPACGSPAYDTKSKSGWPIRCVNSCFIKTNEGFSHLFTRSQWESLSRSVKSMDGDYAIEQFLKWLDTKIVLDIQPDELFERFCEEHTKKLVDR